MICPMFSTPARATPIEAYAPTWIFFEKSIVSGRLEKKQRLEAQAVWQR
jgi:hypothetical protein